MKKTFNMEKNRKKFLDHIIEKDFKKPYINTLRFYDIKWGDEVRYIFDRVFGDRYEFTTIYMNDGTITHGFLTYIKLYDENGNIIYVEDSDGINYDPFDVNILIDIKLIELSGEYRIKFFPTIYKI